MQKPRSSSLQSTPLTHRLSLCAGALQPSKPRPPPSLGHPASPPAAALDEVLDPGAVRSAGKHPVLLYYGVEKWASTLNTSTGCSTLNTNIGFSPISEAAFASFCQDHSSWICKELAITFLGDRRLAKTKHLSLAPLKLTQEISLNFSQSSLKISSVKNKLSRENQVLTADCYGQINYPELTGLWLQSSTATLTSSSLSSGIIWGYFFLCASFYFNFYLFNFALYTTPHCFWDPPLLQADFVFPGFSLCICSRHKYSPVRTAVGLSSWLYCVPIFIPAQFVSVYSSSI